MRKKLCKRIFAWFWAFLFLFSSSAAYATPVQTEPIPEEVEIVEKPIFVREERITLPELEHISIERVEKMPEPVEVMPETTLTQSEIELIARVTMAEAEGEPEEGQRLVIDTILNRVDSPYFPNTVEGVIYQKNQFTCMWNGRIDVCYVKDDILELVYEELESRTDTDVVFFRTRHYSSYGVPMFQVGHHYFSKYM